MSAAWSRWETPLSNADSVWLRELRYGSGELRLTFERLEHAVAVEQVTFRFPWSSLVGFRNALESYAAVPPLEAAALRALGRTRIIGGDEGRRWETLDPYLVPAMKPNATTHVFVAEDDVIQVMSEVPPAIEVSPLVR